jgi:4-amino-4-deoxy-L-arabinose transferase-like glycosyltransferase
VNPGRKVLVAVVGVIALLGLLLRLWALVRHPVNADEAVVGMMARSILHGHFSAFYWGQNYGGGEPYVVAVVFRIFGQSAFTLGVTPVILDAVAAILVFALGRRLFTSGVGIAAALLFWIWPEATLWQSTIEYGFRFATLDCGLGASVIALRLASNADLSSDASATGTTTRKRRIDLAGIGLLIGVGFWCSPEIAYFAIPIAVVLGVRLARRRLRLNVIDVLDAVLALALGALPWLWSNLRNNFGSLHPASQPYPQFSQHFDMFMRHALPIALGLQLHGSGAWLGGPHLGSVVEDLAIVGVAVFLAWSLLQRRAGFLVAFCIAFPLLYSYWPFTWYWSDSRYVMYLPPILAILLAAIVQDVLQHLRLSKPVVVRAQLGVISLVLVLALFSTLDSVYHGVPFRPDRVAGTPAATWTSFQRNPNDFEVTLADELIHAGVHHVYAGYWLAFPLTFASGGSVVASDILFARNPAQLLEVSNSPDPGWLFADPRTSGFFRLVSITGSTLLDPGCALPGTRCLTAPEFEALLGQAAIPYRSIVIGSEGVVVVLPRRKVGLARIVRYVEDVPALR